MYCGNCGFRNENDAIYCSNCGSLMNGTINHNNTSNNNMVTDQSNNYNTLAIVGFALSLISFTSFIRSIAAIVISAIGLSNISKSKEKGTGLAIAGIIIGALSIVISIFFTFLLIAFD